MASNTENEFKRSVSVTDEKLKGDTHEITTASAALAAAVAKQKPNLLSPGMIRLYMIMGIGYLVSTMNGFDSSLMGAINAMETYQETFGLTGAGSTTGIIFIIYQIGQIASFPFCGFFADGYGRRWCIFIGCLIVLVGTAIQATANHLGQFIAGRFILGFGASIASAAGPAYTVELAHPAYRGTMAGMYESILIPFNSYFRMSTNSLAGTTIFGG
jgi:MFS family permease